jgi:hypothetical protein
MYPEKHLDFVRYLRYLSLGDLEKGNEPTSEAELIRCLGIPISTEGEERKRWRCPVVGCKYTGSLYRLASHLRTAEHIRIAPFACTLDWYVLLSEYLYAADRFLAKCAFTILRTVTVM